MFFKVQENDCRNSIEGRSTPRTPTLPGSEEGSPQRTHSFRNRNLKVITRGLNALGSPAVKSSVNKRAGYGNVPIRRNLFESTERHSESMDEGANEHREAVNKKSLRSLSISSNEKNTSYLNEISCLNKKIRNLIKEQESLKDKMQAQENIVLGLQKNTKHFVPQYEVQSATIPKHDSLDDSFFQVTFRPDQWTHRPRRFPRDVFCKPQK